MDIKKTTIFENDIIIDLESFDYDLYEQNEFLRKYFQQWLNKVRDNKLKNEVKKIKLEQREKLDNLVKAIRKHQKLQQQQENDLQSPIAPQKVPIKSATSSANYKNRFEAQKATIEKLTTKLQQQTKIIEHLQLGIFEKDALKSIDNSRNEIREIFADCSVKIQCKLPPPIEYNEQFMLSTQKAPKMVQRMQERAMERAKKHEIIQQRKQMMEEKRKRIMQEALDRKRAQDEEEKKRNLEAMKERRRKEIEQEKIRQANKLIYLQKLDKAVLHYNKKLMKDAFELLVYNYNTNKMNEYKSEKHFKMKTLTTAMAKWKNFVEETYSEKYLLADALFAGKILHLAIKSWKEFHLDCVRCRQVAEDFSDLRVQSSVFVHWHRYVCTQIVRRDKLEKLAVRHYNKRILVHYFYQWRSLPAVMQLERAKEQKKRKWREKVWEIVPDYKPPDD